MFLGTSSTTILWKTCLQLQNCDTPSSQVHPSNQLAKKTCDERGYYKGFNILGDLKEMELMEHHT